MIRLLLMILALSASCAAVADSVQKPNVEETADTQQVVCEQVGVSERKHPLDVIKETMLELIIFLSLFAGTAFVFLLIFSLFKSNNSYEDDCDDDVISPSIKPTQSQ